MEEIEVENKNNVVINDDITFDQINNRINDFSNLDLLKNIDIEDEDYESQKENIINDEISELINIQEELTQKKKEIEEREDKLNKRSEELPQEIEDETIKSSQIQEELTKLEEEFANIDEKDPEYEIKKENLEDKRKELSDVNSNLENLKKEQVDLKEEYKDLETKKEKYEDAKETYDNRIDISFDVINTFEPTKAKELSEFRVEEINRKNDLEENTIQVSNMNQELNPQSQPNQSMLENQDLTHEQEYYNNIYEANEQESKEENSLVELEKVNKFKMFFSKVKEKIKSVFNKVTGKNINDKDAEEIANSEIEKNGTEILNSNENIQERSEELSFKDGLSENTRTKVEEIVEEQLKRELNEKNRNERSIENVLE